MITFDQCCWVVFINWLWHKIKRNKRSPYQKSVRNGVYLDLLTLTKVERLIMLKKLLAAGFICLFVAVLGFARSGYAQPNGYECFQGKFYLYGEVANDSNGPADPAYEHLIDTGLCGFVRCSENGETLVQLILAEEDGNDTTNDNNIYFQSRLHVRRVHTGSLLVL